MAGSDDMQTSRPMPALNAREALIAELLGDADVLLKQADTLFTRADQSTEALTSAVERITASLKQAGDKSSQEITESGRQAQALINAEANQTLQQAKAVAVEVRASTAAMRGESRRFFWRIMMVGALGGFLGALSLFGILLLSLEWLR